MADRISPFTGYRCAGCGAREYTEAAAPGLFEGGKDCTCPHPEWTTSMTWVDALEAGARADRDRYIRAFNRLEKAVTNHVRDCIDADGLAHAHKAVMRDLGPGETA